MTYAFNDTVDTYALEPVARTYRDAVPSMIRQGVTNFFGNIEDLFSAVNGILQGKPEKAGEDIGRVLTNTTFGFLGIVDVAAGAGIEKGEEDFGQTFAVWGMPPGPYVVLPFLGPSNGRDTLGWLLRIPLDPFVEVGSPAMSWSRGLDLRTEARFGEAKSELSRELLAHDHPMLVLGVGDLERLDDRWLADLLEGPVQRPVLIVRHSADAHGGG